MEKREILFRGWNKKNKRWLYGYYFAYHGNHFISPDAKVNPLDTYKDYVIDADSVGQYTGLKDAKGKRIFEGDIIKTPCGFIGEVVFGRTEEECTHMECNRKITDVYTTYGWIFKRADGYTCAIDDEILQGELLGNVKETPELIKTK
ncbi:YopX family protein [Hoylesella buccalis]|uniref:YopX protein domain-containing protein n=1 Tax=Hoylesella buccalis DNF00853 TaxID=1401074 RepID=A0A095ZE51_9BACT|nr:YopX family protein [Hoylesella buccalis]KGF32928.1 hypothetical protein HMPREF2137_12390 [Hoylesella buccalis DNF00853]